jgi:GNAT superfamily N-acetyltransferase
MRRAIDALQVGFLTPEQIAASHAVMGLDTQLVADGSYYLVEADGQLAGCGGWSARATLYGGDHSADLRDARWLDPATDAARIRAMYTHPDFTRRGAGRLVLALCEQAAARAAFRRAELMATLSGEPLYAACGYTVIEPVEARVGTVTVPLLRMGKALTAVA